MRTTPLNQQGEPENKVSFQLVARVLGRVAMTSKPSPGSKEKPHPAGNLAGFTRGDMRVWTGVKLLQNWFRHLRDAADQPLNFLIRLLGILFLVGLPAGGQVITRH